MIYPLILYIVVHLRIDLYIYALIYNVIDWGTTITKFAHIDNDPDLVSSLALFAVMDGEHFQCLREVFMSRAHNIIIMKFTGWLLDVDYIVENNRPLIRMWCIDDSGRSAVIFDNSFEPYFYLVPYGDVPASSLENMSEEVGGEIIKPVRVDMVDRKNFGVPMKSYRIFTQLPRDVPYMRELALKFGDVREADILFGVRYIIDKRLTPMSGIEAEGEPVAVDYADTGILCSSPKAFAREDIPPVKVLAFDCEMSNPHGMPDPKRDPIIIIGIKTNAEEKLLTASGDSDKALIKEFIQYVKDYDPDVIVGYNQDGFDWPYINERAKRHKIKLSVCRDGTAPMFGRGGLQKKVKLIGRLDIDLFHVAAAGRGRRQDQNAGQRSRLFGRHEEERAGEHPRRRHTQVLGR